MDRVSLSGKALFIFGHNVALAEYFIVVQVISAGIDDPAGFSGLFKRKIKEGAVVSFKLNPPPGRENLVIAGQKFFAGETPFGMAVLGPGI